MSIDTICNIVVFHRSGIFLYRVFRTLWIINGTWTLWASAACMHHQCIVLVNCSAFNTAIPSSCLIHCKMFWHFLPRFNNSSYFYHCSRLRLNGNNKIVKNRKCTKALQVPCVRSWVQWCSWINLLGLGPGVSLYNPLWFNQTNLKLSWRVDKQ